MMKRIANEASAHDSYCGTIQDAKMRYNYGYHTIRRIAEEAHATIRVGRTNRYNFRLMDAYLDSISE